MSVLAQIVTVIAYVLVSLNLLIAIYALYDALTLGKRLDNEFKKEREDKIEEKQEQEEGVEDEPEGEIFSCDTCSVSGLNNNIEDIEPIPNVVYGFSGSYHLGYPQSD